MVFNTVALSGISSERNRTASTMKVVRTTPATTQRRRPKISRSKSTSTAANPPHWTLNPAASGSAQRRERRSRT